jgi:hypothetical protein
MVSCTVDFPLNQSIDIYPEIIQISYHIVFRMNPQMMLI